MLFRYNGASTLGKSALQFRNMTSFGGSSPLATDAMRSTMSLIRGGKAAALSPRATAAVNVLQTWRPWHGIVFGDPGGRTTRQMSTRIEEHTAGAHNGYPDLTESLGRLGALETTESLEKLAGTETTEAEAEAEGETEEAAPKDSERDELPESTTDFKIPEEKFRAAKNAIAGSSESFWSHTLYRGPPLEGVEQKVKVHYCKTLENTERVLQQYFKDEKVLGFDIEWKAQVSKAAGPKKNVSLVQLASEQRIALFHVALFKGDTLEELVPPTLKSIMEDSSITKVGVAIKADCTRLRNFLDIHAQGIFELSHTYKLVKYSKSNEYKLINKKLVSLSQQVEEHLNLPLFKGEVRGSDWSLPLAMDQILYAAADSYAGFHLWDVLEIKRKALDPTPPVPYHAELNLPIRIAEGVEILSDDEPDAEEPETPTSKQPQHLSSKFLAEVEQSLEVDPETEAEDPPATIPTTTKRSKSNPAAKDPLVQAAATLADHYRATHHQNRASPSALRCYFLWHANPELSLPEVAALLRDVPLQNATVATYVCDAVRFEKLPYDAARMRGVLGHLSLEVTGRRYRALAKECETLGGDEA